ncbi:hypothetical protein FKR81_14820 [Lentzea tibetensis]|uniref:NACHT domain-containing protein n=1 Tax=Lentzea tibetensis TaxID=2591470 RepID=A0A563EV63_9PSEU|nr:hypothetical protein [Lentzea tibetensis]TWP51482.1 hypothetical protein FKR81_14820 [Lentzea tibetensis]
MTYDYEALLDEAFQMVCQALLVAEHKDVQCLPVGMPDGGRDALRYVDDGHGIIVYQVKFARKPNMIKDPLKWLINAIDDELPKIANLASRGARKYVLITNMSTSSHLDIGKLDKLNKHFKKSLPIPALCWWRDDLDRRLDNNFDLKLRYPALLTGADIPRLIMEAGPSLTEERRRATALIAYLSHQHEQDSTLRFKQAEVESQLLDLFVDVPMTSFHGPALGADDLQGRAFRRFIFTKAQITRYRSKSRLRPAAMLTENEVHGFQPGGRQQPPAHAAADVLLDPFFHQGVNRVVLEGAPGQGKSTLAQYVAQVQRVRILKEHAGIAKLPDRHRDSPVMLPIKIELRDIAMWLRGIDPWASSPGEEHGRAKTLESAIAGHIARYSGGFDFAVSDVHEVVGNRPVLLILDALDEVADLDDRLLVVDEITAALVRMDSTGQRLSVIVTSRPTAIANSPTLSGKKFAYFSLASIDQSLALEYTSKWAKVRGLSANDIMQLQRTLRLKLQSSHTAELGKNTMQLSILLNLIHVRGESLPDKRTALYDTYVDVFLNRESEKSPVVRDNRELLVSIHQFLGYYLHALAEKDKSSGRIETSELRALLVEYLENEGHPTELVDYLWSGVVERVVALVSRVEGTYEFEVQPLREYFAARYLYDTASYSPSGHERAGTKPERFAGIAGNTYWLNVTRFYAGCFSVGELRDLADRVCDLFDPELSGYHMLFPRSLAFFLLEDWVFNQSPKAVNQVVEKVFDDVGIRWLFASDPSLDGQRNTQLSPKSGGSRLVALFLERIGHTRSGDQHIALCNGIAIHDPAGAMTRNWLADNTSWFEDYPLEWAHLAGVTGLISRMTPQESDRFLNADASREARLSTLLIYGNEHVYASREILNEVCRIALNNRSTAISLRRTPSPLALWANVVIYTPWSAFATGDIPPENFFRAFNSDENPRIASLRKVSAELEAVLLSINASKSKGDLSPFGFARTFTQTLLEQFGFCWSALEIANIGASIPDQNERGAGAGALFDSSFPLIDRLRNARRRGNQKQWWLEQYSRIESPSDAATWAIAFFSWARGDVHLSLIGHFDDVIQRMDSTHRDSLIGAAAVTEQYSGRVPDLHDAGGSLAELNSVHSSTRAMYLEKMPLSAAVDFLKRDVATLALTPALAVRYTRLIARAGASEDIDWTECLEIVRLINNTKELAYDQPLSRTSYREFGTVSVDLCKEILDNAWELPDMFVSLAFMWSGGPKRVRAVQDIAQERGWFEHNYLPRRSSR